MPPVILGPRCNRRVTCDASPSNARSESAIAVNPLDPYNMVGASKRFTNPENYEFSLAAYATFDGGVSWIEAPSLKLLKTGDLDDGGVMWTGDSWAGTSDPAIAWDNMGNAYLVALAAGIETQADPLHLLGIAVYRSSDGGRTWSAPKVIHKSINDDKQWAAGDINSASPYYGNVYVVWDNGSLAFARTTNHGASWKGIKVNGVEQPAGTALPGIFDSFAPELSVAANGSIYVVWRGVTGIKVVKSIDGGDSFFDPTSNGYAASGITTLESSALPKSPSDGVANWPHFPGATFRVLTFPTSCTGAADNVIVAWADARDTVGGNPISRIYFRRSTNGGQSWEGPESGQPLLTGTAASAADQHDFHPQLISTPSGEIGCAFYNFGPKGGQDFPPMLIDVVLAVSTDGGAMFPHRMTVTNTPWDPAYDAPSSHGQPLATFIGDYFGLDASRLGFFPFWTDTRTLVQEIFTSRIAVKPADVYIRDSNLDLGDVPTPGNEWNTPDLVIRNQQDGDAVFEDQGAEVGQENYIYGKVFNRGPNTARNVRLAVTLVNYAGTDFFYPQDWYAKDWDSSFLKETRLFLGASDPVNISANKEAILGPVLWPADKPYGFFQGYSLLAEARADNDDSAGGTGGCEFPYEQDACNYSCYSWGNNNICVRSEPGLVLPTLYNVICRFLIGCPLCPPGFVEVIVEKSRELALIPMKLRMEPVGLAAKRLNMVTDQLADLVLVDGGRAVVRVESQELGELIAAPGTIWRGRAASSKADVPREECFGGKKIGQEWILTERRASVGFAAAAGEMREVTLSFTAPKALHGTRARVRLFQRNDRRVITGSVTMQLEVGKLGNGAR
jgi:hypothetical protein